MGSNDWWPKCQPEHKISLKGFYIDKYEVTNKRYKRFVEAARRKPPAHWVNGEIPKGRADHPVVFVTWNDANDFCQWEGKRLPTEPEWEKSARGTDKRTFPWGDKFDAHKGNMPQLGKGDTMPVGSFENGKSPYGIYDLAGNVWEWTDDWFKPYPGNKHPDENYGEKYRVLRGGSWYDCTYYKCGISAPTYNRIFFNPLTMNNNFGFRCAKDAKDEVTSNRGDMIQ
jgi:formylglycine-generating enzyme required for sulfatase activity